MHVCSIYRSTFIVVALHLCSLRNLDLPSVHVHDWVITCLVYVHPIWNLQHEFWCTKQWRHVTLQTGYTGLSQGARMRKQFYSSTKKNYMMTTESTIFCFVTLLELIKKCHKPWRFCFKLFLYFTKVYCTFNN